MATVLEITVGHQILSVQIFENDWQILQYVLTWCLRTYMTTLWNLFNVAELKSYFFTAALRAAALENGWYLAVRYQDCLKSDLLQLRTTMIISKKKNPAGMSEHDLTKCLKNAAANSNIRLSKCCLLCNCKVSLHGICRDICCFLRLSLQKWSCSSWKITLSAFWWAKR